MAENGNAIRSKLGVRELADIGEDVNFRLAFHPPAWILASIHPALVVADVFAVADAKAAELARAGHPALAAESRATGDERKAFARRVEDVILAARTLAHFTGGRTLDMHAWGDAVEATRAAYEMERGYFDGLYVDGRRQDG